MYMSELYHIFNKIKNKLRVCKVESIYNDSTMHSDYMSIFINFDIYMCEEDTIIVFGNGNDVAIVMNYYSERDIILTAYDSVLLSIYGIDLVKCKCLYDKYEFKKHFDINISQFRIR